MNEQELLGIKSDSVFVRFTRILETGILGIRLKAGIIIREIKDCNFLFGQNHSLLGTDETLNINKWNEVGNGDGPLFME